MKTKEKKQQNFSRFQVLCPGFHLKVERKKKSTYKPIVGSFKIDIQFFLLKAGEKLLQDCYSEQR